MVYSDEIIEEVRVNNDIVDVISDYVQLKKKGSTYFGLCPFHNEKTPSFSVEPSKQFFHCFGCGKGGNVIHFIMAIENLDFVEALKLLAERAHINLPEPNDEEYLKSAENRKKILEINKLTAKYYYKQLCNKKNILAQNYLLNRKLTEDTIKKFGLGYSNEAWDDLYKYLSSKGYDDNILLLSGLMIKTKKGNLADRFRGRIMFPIFNIRGNVVGFGGRVTDNSLPKYMNSPDTPVYQKGRELYALNFAKNTDSKKLLIVEGYMDVISLHQRGINFAVASLGTALTTMQARILRKYSEEIVISYDADTAGQAATMRGLDILGNTGCKVKVLSVPDGKDPDEFIKKNGPDKFKSLIDGALSLIEYKIATARKKYPEDMEGKLAFLNDIADILSTVDNSIEIEMYASKLAKDYDISDKSLLNEVIKKKERDKKGNYSKKNAQTITSNKKVTVAKEKKHNNIVLHNEKLLIAILCNCNNLFQYISNFYKVDDFSEGTTREIAKYVYEKLKNGNDIVLVELLNKMEEKEASEFIKIVKEECFFDNSEIAAMDIINKITLTRLETKKKEIIEQMKNIKDDATKMELNKQLSSIIYEIAKRKVK